MQRLMCKGKIHRATVTEADLESNHVICDCGSTLLADYDLRANCLHVN
ncbi:aspartate 1-decarboxylase [Paenibacillus sp. SYP-B3998]|uniref:Aspartate 1-decarboxylase n=1 Tax=Paenibacillus sp. SYP-B3998 TaxID=2678564 RepID=A0A6G3ZX73_9BACL|nr:hypothetical protein [Paenibacillus sp. SYP-B3998]NEW06304.1 aspartate 1-decarboxylase [Paenibacillus sp. SYP-B3998]